MKVIRMYFPIPLLWQKLINKFFATILIIPFLSKYGIDDEYLSFIRNIEKFKTRGDDIYISRDDETAFAEYEFLKQSIHDILKIYPSIIINKVDYKSISVPKHWGLAPNHKNDITHFIEKEFIPLQSFYDDPAITSLLKKVMDKSDSILEIMNSRLTNVY